jgi:putative phosphoserine phosphatase/1-acylglycerol-3-phosphate O-acyltransferase
MLRGWPIVYLDAPAGVPKLMGVEPLDLMRVALPHIAAPFARFEISGIDNIAANGPVIVAANHRSYFDPVAYGLAVLGSGRHPRGMAKKELFDAPVIGQLLKAGGAICVDRDGNAKEAYRQAEDALRAGEVVLIAPQGTIPRGSAFFEPDLQGKTGAARLAAATGAPVVPLGLWGTEAVWPRSMRLPKFAPSGRRPVVSVRVGRPVEGLSGTDAEADTRLIMSAIVDLLPLEARRKREPSADDIANTFPA